MSKVFVVIPAAGMGERMGAGVNKVLLELDGQVILQRTLSIFEDLPEVAAIQVVCRAEERDWINAQQINWGISKALSACVGGETRQESVFNGLKVLAGMQDFSLEEDGEHPIVLIHDAARCLVTADIIRRCINHVEAVGSCVAAVPVKDTIKRVSADGIVHETLVRDELWQIQTPQAFRFASIINAYQSAEKNGLLATDDASVMEALGEDVAVVEGSYQNIKLTTAEDLVIAQAYLQSRQQSE